MLLSVLTNGDIAEMCQRVAEHLRQLNMTIDPARRTVIARMIQRLEHPENIHLLSYEMMAH
jgi:hypothetical protein